MSATDSKPVEPLSILVADDSLLHQQLTAKLLQKDGHVVHVVGTGEDAAHAVLQEHFDLVLMDVEMPVMDGLAATRKIRDAERYRGGHVPIIAFTSVDDADLCIEAGADDHLVKPSSRLELRKAIQQTLKFPA